MSKQTIVGIADMKIIRAPGTLITYALGSCVGICFYDPVIRLAGLLHILLPVCQKAPPDNIFKYADCGIRETIRKLERFGAVRSRLEIKIAGGAKMFELAGGSSLGNIGQMNIDSVKAILREERLRIQKEDVGQNFARTLVLDAETGIGVVRAFGRGEMTF